MDDLTLYPEPAQLRRINRELVAYVRRGFPMRFYGRHSEHSAFVAGALLRMCDAVESQMLLMTRRRDTDDKSSFARSMSR